MSRSKGKKLFTIAFIGTALVFNLQAADETGKDSVRKPSVLEFVSAKAGSKQTADGLHIGGDYTFLVKSGTASGSKPIKKQATVTLKESFTASSVYYKVAAVNLVHRDIPAASDGVAQSGGTDDDGKMVDNVVDLGAGTTAQITNDVIALYQQYSKFVTYIDRYNFQHSYWISDSVSGDAGSSSSPLITQTQQIGAKVNWPPNVSDKNPPTASIDLTGAW